MNQTAHELNIPSAPHTNLPVVLTSFVGRKRELAEVTQLLTASRLVTLTGAAGCGKTRLALRAATSLRSHFADGIYWIELTRLTDPALMPKAIAKVLHIVEQRGRPLTETLLDALQDKHLLLVLDNCEHLLEACAHLVDMLLAATGVTLLATSREPLAIPGERRYPVAPLALPPATGTAPESLAHFDAIQLFVERARALVPNFELTTDNADAVASICHQLDGIPLSIELASARVNVLTVDEIAVRLDRRFDLLPPATHLTYSHHQTLRAAIDWSHDLLVPAEQVMLRRLSVFATGCSLATAEAVCAGDGVERHQVLDLLASLVGKSLLAAKTLGRSEARYVLLETIRQYAHEKLAASGEGPLVHERYLHCYLQLVEETEPKLKGPYQELWLNWLEEEYDNIRATLTWAFANDHIEAGLRIITALYQFWTIRDYVEEGFAWFERLLARVDERTSAVVHARALAHATFMAGFRGNNAAQMAYGRKAARFVEVVRDQDKEALALALAAQAWGLRAEGDHQTELTLNNQVIQLYRELEDEYDLGLCLTTSSFTAMSLRKYGVARAMLDEGLPLLRKVGTPYRIAMALNFSGDLARCEQKYVQAQAAYEESIVLLRELDAVRDLASVLHNLGHTCLHLGDVERADTLFHESIALHLAHHNTPGVAECLIGFAALAIVRGLPGAGARLLAAVIAIGGERVATAWQATQMEYEHYLARVRDDLTETEFQVEQAVGRTYALEQAVAYAHDVALKGAAVDKSRKKLDVLTEREREVAALIAQAKANGEIAEELVVSKRTVESHIANILSKLGFTKRAQIVRWAIEIGLVTSGE